MRDRFTSVKIAWGYNKKRLPQLALNKISKMQERKKIINYNEYGKSDRYAAISYITEPFVSTVQDLFTSTSRQNVWQAKKIVDIFNKLGYTVDIYEHDSESVDIENPQKYDVVFGQGVNFDRLTRNSKATKIYYAPGMHWSQRNEAINKELERINKEYGIKLSAVRKMVETKGPELADALIVIGDEYTVDTYSNHIDDIRTYNLYPTTYDFLSYPDAKVFNDNKDQFLWFSGTGFITKGLDITLKAFSEIDQADLYVCGPLDLEPEFMRNFGDVISSNKNIHKVGWVDTKSKKFENLTKQCTYIIHPSISEGFPGSVAHCMKRGVIPVITNQVHNGMDNISIKANERSISGIENAINQGIETEDNELKSMSKKCNSFAVEKFSRDVFEQNFSDYLTQILKID